MEPQGRMVNRAAVRAGVRRLVSAPVVAGGLAMLLLAGCRYMPPLPDAPRDIFDSPRVQRGHAVPAEQISQITPGVTRRDDVRALLGSPSHSGTFNDDAWYYISSTTRQRPGRALAVTEQRVVVVRFDAGGAVREVSQLGEGEHRNVAFVSRETPVPGNDRTLLQGLFGNIGAFNNAPTAGGPGVGAQGR